MSVGEWMKGFITYLYILYIYNLLSFVAVVLYVSVPRPPFQTHILSVSPALYIYIYICMFMLNCPLFMRGTNLRYSITTWVQSHNDTQASALSLNLECVSCAFGCVWTCFSRTRTNHYHRRSGLRVWKGKQNNLYHAIFTCSIYISSSP